MVEYNFTNYSQVLICGDIHGNFGVAYGDSLIQDTLIIVAGDCGFGFQSQAYYENLYKTKISRRLNKKRNTVLFIRGNHDDPAYFDGMKFRHKWAVCIPDYSVVRTANHTILCVGGAISIDRNWRKEKTKQEKRPLYWMNEEPVFDIEKVGEITSAGIKIDTVITHTSPSFCEPQTKDGVKTWMLQDENLEEDLDRERSAMNSLYLALKEQNHPLRQWWYGHYHFSAWNDYDGCYFRLLDIGEKDYLRG
ncbi:MAG: metallophosphoesterase [Tannerellaceae bacterium]|jgi:predicted phosphodiesterase|nr:metallophosphoesterase [Tannerellaceae bacterium]